MCILIHHPKDSCFTSEQLQDFYSKNSDGFGAIVKDNEGVHVVKMVGTYQQIEDLYYERVACYDAIIHFRMKTHGDIDLANCHPYEVMPGLWMAHNGILSTGNAADTKMSDTWHYINDYLRPMLEANPDLLHVEAFRKLVGNHIGSSNKFGFMNSKGETFIINKSSGVEHEGIWYSNTYAWTPWKFGLGKAPTVYGGGYVTHTTGGKKSYDHSKFATSPTWKHWNEIDTVQRALPLDAPLPKAKRKQEFKKAKASKRLPTDSLAKIIRSCYNAVLMNDYDGVLRWVQDKPMSAINLIYELCGSENNPMYCRESVSDKVSNDPDWAAETIWELWYDLEDVLLQLAGIRDEEGESYVR